MPTTQDFNRAAIERAKQELRLYQNNIIAETSNGSRLQAVWEGDRFVDFQLGEPMEDVIDFWVDHALPTGGFMPNQFTLKL